jgi:hypothetical protein
MDMLKEKILKKYRQFEHRKSVVRKYKPIVIKALEEARLQSQRVSETQGPVVKDSDGCEENIYATKSRAWAIYFRNNEIYEESLVKLIPLKNELNQLIQKYIEKSK